MPNRREMFWILVVGLTLGTGTCAVGAVPFLQDLFQGNPSNSLDIAFIWSGALITMITVILVYLSRPKGGVVIEEIDESQGGD
ncbi:hypothetical protein HQ571_05470 [Candidatus Kuenenbacteria bacterium]|nr:hypothetical protein [Candidatus Kuenenbacteria bacterium]